MNTFADVVILTLMIVDAERDGRDVSREMCRRWVSVVKSCHGFQTPYSRVFTDDELRQRMRHLQIQGIGRRELDGIR